MARFIIIAPYIKGRRSKARRANLTRYIATRDGVEKLPAGKAERENYTDYIATRPGVKKSGEHGLFNSDGKVENLSAAIETVASHPGYIFTPILSLKREDAERLGYTNAENWRALLNSHALDFAEAYKIPHQDFRWYAALHEKENHVHVHMLIYSENSSKGFLTKQGLMKLRSTFANDIFRDELLHVYEKKSAYRKETKEEAGRHMKELIRQMEQGEFHNPKIERLLARLVGQLSCTSGKKVYGYLPPRVKVTIDEIVDELAKDERVAAAYDLWQDAQEEVIRTYRSNMPERVSLSKQIEFRSVRNMVLKEALKLTVLEAGGEMKAIYSEDEPNPYISGSVLRMFHHMGNIFRLKLADGSGNLNQMDKKRKQKVAAKRAAAGHKRDDHEDQKNNIQELY